MLDLYGSISYEQLNDSPDTSNDAILLGAEDTPILVNEATVKPDTVPKN